ncbi:3-hydroxyacyl-ACP dehydratase [Aureibaculum sp. 2210JD6-5]|uniref:3-hydroxyacyl-ACP dehydratase n=1 Tax=Aureibaculum sp. 2210JD6-5 TaxID=3103957 RepID=UPI002AAC6493|nr:3-hydroxyacyl-ACP dehydratase [Aureibaculum sp. 2210JD6-5]MDY7393863.1 3-hydroxyacyl-ACP dehydratase [Aureibaculum sp. 2210JD6-5]
MLLKNLYKILTFNFNEGELQSEIFINQDHEIFKGHFPGNPVMPGVCMIQIIKELTEKALDKKLFMEKSSNIKFMALINPEVNNTLVLNLNISDENDEIKVKNITKMGDTVALKFNGVYRVVD